MDAIKKYVDKNVYKGTVVRFTHVKNRKVIYSHFVFESKWHWFIRGDINDDKYLNRCRRRRYGRYGGKDSHWWPLSKSLLQ